MWFRGLSKHSYELLPSIYRKKMWNYNANDEKGLEDEFIRQARSFNVSNHQNLSRWEWYQIMQHHGLPTRLLDRTSASNIALYFALRNLNSIKNPTVWMIDPIWINNKTTDSDCIFYTDPSIQEKSDHKVVKNYVPTSVTSLNYLLLCFLRM